MGRDGRPTLAKVAAQRLAARAVSPDFLRNMPEVEFADRLMRFERGLAYCRSGGTPSATEPALSDAERARRLSLLGPQRAARIFEAILAHRRAGRDHEGASQLEVQLTRRAWWRDRATGTGGP